MKTTPYTDLHIKLGAKMAEFAGYNMPIQYTGLVEEHNNVRNNVGVFDVSHMGEFRAKGPIAKHFMQYVTTNNVEDLFDGKVQYTCLPNGQGGVVDDMLVYRVHDDEYFMVPNAQWAQLAVQGPNALKAMQKLTSENIVDMEYYTFKILTFAGIPNIILSTTGYTGAGGCEIYIPKEKAIEVWDAVFEAGKEYGIMPAGLGCRDTLRLEKGFALYGHEMDDTVSPLEAPLAFIVKLKAENNNFINKELLLAQKAAGFKRKVAGFEMIDRGATATKSATLRATRSVKCARVAPAPRLARTSAPPSSRPSSPRAAPRSTSRSARNSSRPSPSRCRSTKDNLYA